MKMRDVWGKVNVPKNAELICYLWERWQDEHEYEDFNDYFKAVKECIPEITKMTKRPFGFKAECSDGVLTVTVRCEGDYLAFDAEMQPKAA